MCFINERNDFFRHQIVIIKKKLAVIVDPKESQVFSSQLLKEVWKLPACCVDNMSDLVGKNQILILGAHLVAKKQPIMDADYCKDSVTVAFGFSFNLKTREFHEF